LFLEIIHRTGRNLNTALHSNTQFETWISIEKTGSYMVNL